MPGVLLRFWWWLGLVAALAVAARGELVATRDASASSPPAGSVSVARSDEALPNDEDARPAVRMPGGWIWTAPPVFRFQRGDDPRWAEPDFDDTAWPTILPSEVPARDGIYWVRFRVSADEMRDDAGEARDGVALTILASYDLYWDGRLIGRNGDVAARAEDEIPGRIDALFQIPPDLATPREHVVALRLASFHSGFATPYYGINYRLGSFAPMIAEHTRRSLGSLVAMGAMSGLALGFGIAAWLVDRRRAVGLLGAVALSAAIIQALQAWRWLQPYAYAWHYPRTVALTLLAAGLGWALFAAVASLVGLPRRRLLLAALVATHAAAWAASPLFSTRGFAIFTASLVFAAGAAAWAALRRRRHAGVLLVGLLITLLSLVARPGDFAERTFALSFGATLAAALVSLALRWRDERRGARQARLTAARLEIELLKKNIQPHFLMNTLASLMEVVETDPATAVTLIDALAEEFRILARMSGERLVPIAQEIALCEAHLRIMSLRRQRPAELRTSGLDPAARVPPALIHTLVENGFTHQSPGADARDATVFHLHGETSGRGVRYTFTAPRAAGEATGRESPALGPAPDGTGLRYVKARLEESFPGRWTLTAGPVAGSWRTIVEFGADSESAPAP